MESAVLGAIILDNRLARSVLGELSADCFYLDRNRVIYSSMLELYERSLTIDSVTVGQRLSEAERKRIGGVAYLSSLADNIGALSAVSAYVLKLQQLAKHRKLITVCLDSAELGYKSVDTVDYIDETRRKILDAANSVVETRSEAVVDITSRVYDEILSNKKPDGLVRTGIRVIDDAYGGLWAGVTNMLAARPSMGKSALALTIMANAALAGKRVLGFSLEDLKRFIIMRLFARFADVDLGRIVRGCLGPEERARIERARPIIECMPLKIDDTSSYTVDALRSQLYREIDDNGVDLVVIDHLLKLRGNGINKYEKITDSIEKLTATLKDANVANLVLHQLNRQNVHRESKVPTLSDLRGSGDIEQEIRTAWFLHRDSYYDDDEDPNSANLIIAKNSHGQTGAVELYCDLSRMYFGDKEERNV